MLFFASYVPCHKSGRLQLELLISSLVSYVCDRQPNILTTLSVRMSTFWMGLGFDLYILVFAAIVFGVGIWKVRQKRLRWPLDFKLLRGPGESLRKKVQRFDENLFFMVLAAALVPIGAGLLT